MLCYILLCYVVVDGAAIMGLERTAVYEEQQVEKENKKENDTVLKMLMKKSGMYSYQLVL